MIIVEIKICDYCGKGFDSDAAEETFSDEFALFNYNNFTKCLCGECAIQAIEDNTDDYEEQCENCRTSFNPFQRNVEFERQTDNYYDSSKILCLDCAIDEHNDFLIRNALMQIKYENADPEDFSNIDLEGYYLDEWDNVQQG